MLLKQIFKISQPRLLALTLTIPENTTTLETFREPALPGKVSHVP